MTKNSKSILFVILSALISNVAIAESASYGSATYGAQSASRDGFSYATSLGAFTSTPYGAGLSIDFMLGLNFGGEKNLFLELSNNRLLLDDAILEAEYSRFCTPSVRRIEPNVC